MTSRTPRSHPWRWSVGLHACLFVGLFAASAGPSTLSDEPLRLQATLRGCDTSAELLPELDTHIELLDLLDEPEPEVESQPLNPEPDEVLEDELSDDAFDDDVRETVEMPHLDVRWVTAHSKPVPSPSTSALPAPPTHVPPAPPVNRLPPVVSRPVSRAAPAPVAVRQVPRETLRVLYSPAVSGYYPYDARERQQEGRVTVGFEVSPAGGVLRVWVVRSSGVTSLDAAALRLVQDTHFAAGRSRRTGRLPVDFVLRAVGGLRR